jgi:hypothetical protein
MCIFSIHYKQKKKKNSLAFGPQANYTNSATVTGRQILMPTFVDRAAERIRNIEKSNDHLGI